MGARVGIPRALLYYEYFPLWETFFKTLGAEVVVSDPTNKAILNEGVKSTVDDACLPVKVAVGHVASLSGRVDYIFLPRLISVTEREYLCPNFLGFPDVVRHILPNLPPLITVAVDLYRRGRGLYRALSEAGSVLTRNPFSAYGAYCRAVAAQKKYRRLLECGLMPREAIKYAPNPESVIPDGHFSQPHGGPLVAVIGHSYNIFDTFSSRGILKKLGDAGVKAVTANMLAEDKAVKEASRLPKKIFWTLSRQMVGAAFYFVEKMKVDGLIYISSFGCGPDSVTGVLIERYARMVKGLSYLNLVLDEHSAEAGVLTRIEAFLDTIRPGFHPTGCTGGNFR